MKIIKNNQFKIIGFFVLITIPFVAYSANKQDSFVDKASDAELVKIFKDMVIGMVLAIVFLFALLFNLN